MSYVYVGLLHVGVDEDVSDMLDEEEVGVEDESKMASNHRDAQEVDEL